MKTNLFRLFVSSQQLSALRHAARGEERKWFGCRMMELAALITDMPKTYEQDGKGENAVAYLHYFTPGGDWYITEKDREGVGIDQAFGLADLGQGGELGYISIRELIRANAELDFYFTPKTLAQIITPRGNHEPPVACDDRCHSV